VNHIKEILTLDAAIEYSLNLSGHEIANMLNVFATWELSFERLKPEDGPKQHKANLFSFRQTADGLPLL